MSESKEELNNMLIENKRLLTINFNRTMMSY